MLDPTHWKETTLLVLLVPRDHTAPPFTIRHFLVLLGLILATEPPIVPYAQQDSSASTQLRVLLLVLQGVIVSVDRLAVPCVRAEAIALQRIQVLSHVRLDSTLLVERHLAPNARREIIVLTEDRQQSVHLEHTPFHDLKPVKFVQKVFSVLARLSELLVRVGAIAPQGLRIVPNALLDIIALILPIFPLHVFSELSVSKDKLIALSVPLVTTAPVPPNL